MADEALPTLLTCGICGREFGDNPEGQCFMQHDGAGFVEEVECLRLGYEREKARADKAEAEVEFRIRYPSPYRCPNCDTRSGYFCDRHLGGDEAFKYAGRAAPAAPSRGWAFEASITDPTIHFYPHGATVAASCGAAPPIVAGYPLATPLSDYLCGTCAAKAVQ